MDQWKGEIYNGRRSCTIASRGSWHTLLSVSHSTGGTHTGYKSAPRQNIARLGPLITCPRHPQQRATRRVAIVRQSSPRFFQSQATSSCPPIQETHQDTIVKFRQLGDNFRNPHELDGDRIRRTNGQRAACGSEGVHNSSRRWNIPSPIKATLSTLANHEVYSKNLSGTPLRPPTEKRISMPDAAGDSPPAPEKSRTTWPFLQFGVRPTGWKRWHRRDKTHNFE